MEKKTTIQDKLNAIQCCLVAPKSQYNQFGKYRYRSCEDILNALKNLLNEQGVAVTLSDEVVMIGQRVYVKATATLVDGKETISTTAYAREDEIKKGMDGSQITGTASSYARKYALNGLFAIDDTKDADALNRHGADEAQSALETAEALLQQCTTPEQVAAIWRTNTQLQDNPAFKQKVKERGSQLKAAAA